LDKLVIIRNNWTLDPEVGEFPRTRGGFARELGSNFSLASARLRPSRVAISTQVEEMDREWIRLVEQRFEFFELFALFHIDAQDECS